jgi:hypothetical protein
MGRLIKQTRFAFKRLGGSHRKSRYFEPRLANSVVACRCVSGKLQCQVQLQKSPCSATSYFTLLWYKRSRVSTYTECNQWEIVGRIPRKSTGFFSARRIYLSTFKYELTERVETFRGSYVGLPAHTCRVWLSDKDANFIKNRGLSRACFVVRPVSAPRTCRSTSARGRKTKDPICSTPSFCNSASSSSLLGLLTHYGIAVTKLHKTEGLPLKLIILVCILLYIMGKYTGVTLGRGRGGKCPFNILRFFFVPELKRANKIWMSGGKGVHVY